MGTIFWLVLRLAPLVAFGWFAVHGPGAAVAVSGVIAVMLLASDAIRNPAILKGPWIGVIGMMLGALVCWATGFLLVRIIGASETVYIGPGFDRWNLPGTILGAAVWVSAIIWQRKRTRARRSR